MEELLIQGERTLEVSPILINPREDPPVFLPHFKNPCWYDRSNLMDVQRIQLTKTCFPAVGAKNKTCNELNIKLSKLRCLPYFMLIGMPKSGSTDLYQRIVKHPDVIGGRTKGTHWWTRSHGRPITRYLDHFSKLVHALQSPKNDKKATLITGDGSVSTLWDNTWWWNSEYRNDEEPGLLTANFIRHIVPEVKLLVILRNPVDRLYSGYLYFNKKFSAADFHKRVTTELKTFKKCLTEHSIRHCAYKGRPQEVRLNIGLYVLYLKEWMDIFPRDHFLILQFEEYSRQTQETMSTVYKFLTLRDLSHEYGTQSSHANQRKPSARKVGPMLKETRVLLETFYEPYNKALASLMNDTRFLWKTPTRV